MAPEDTPGMKPVDAAPAAESAAVAPLSSHRVRSWSWLYEMPLAFLALVAFQRWMFPELQEFRALNPHPLWLPVLAFSLRYGVLAGLFSGLGSAGLFILGVVASSESYLLRDSDFYLRPGMFVAAGAALGLVAESWGKDADTRTGRIRELETRNGGLLEQLRENARLIGLMEQQVVSQMSSIVTLFQGARELGTLNRRELMPGILKFFTHVVGATKSSLYRNEAAGWILAGEIGWEEGDRFPRSLKMTEGLIGRAGMEKRVVSVKDHFAGAEPSSAADCLVAAPILGPDGSVVAVFAVQLMDFMRFNTATLNLMALLSEWGSESFAKCERVEDLKSRTVYDEEFSVHSAAFFDVQLSREFDRSRRQALPFSLLLVALDLPADASERHDDLLKVIGRVLRESVRTTDAVARTPIERAPFAVLMPTTTRETAETVCARINETTQRLGLPALRMGVGSFGPEMANKEELVVQATSALL